ncbi:hypothetical protein GQ457_10G014940 [Hibiscus cannabinus]
MGHVRSVYHYEPKYKKTWRGKDKAIKKLYGDWDASYNDLPAWINIMQKYNPGTIADLETPPSYRNDLHPNNQESKIRKHLPERLEKSHTPISGTRGNRRKKQGDQTLGIYMSSFGPKFNLIPN